MNGGTGDQLYGDVWKRDLLCAHPAVYTDVELYCCTPETYVMLQTNVSSIKQNKTILKYSYKFCCFHSLGL